MKPAQSLAGYIRQHLTELEVRLDVGVRQEVIVAELETHGYKTTLKGFRNFLYRARLRAAKKGAIALTTPTTQKEIQNVPIAQAPVKPKKEVPQNPLTKNTGFKYKGTLNFDEDDLI